MMKCIAVVGCFFVFAMAHTACSGTLPGFGESDSTQGDTSSHEGTDGGGTNPGGTDSSGNTHSDGGTSSDTGVSAPQYPELWYSSGQYLVHVELSEEDGSVVAIHPSLMEGLPMGQNMLTMLDDGSLLGARLAKSDFLTYFYYISSPPRDGSPVEYAELGVMPGEIMLEGLYTDCDGRLYGMDTGVNDTSAEGNRLLRFLGSVIKGNFEFQVVSDLSTAVVADIDDMGPGIDENGNITDNPGLAIDSGTIYDFDYVLGTGTAVAKGGTWGIHALGGTLFKDNVSRIYLLSSSAQLFELNPQTYEVSGVLATGPTTEGAHSGWSGLAGPLTDCKTGFPPVY